MIIQHSHVIGGQIELREANARDALRLGGDDL